MRTEQEIRKMIEGHKTASKAMRIRADRSETDEMEGYWHSVADIHDDKVEALKWVLEEEA